MEGQIQGLPSWIGAAERNLLQNNVNFVERPNAVVAADGSGTFKTVNDAVAAYPPNFRGRFVIYVKQGTYKEKVTVDQNKPNLFLYGDGMGKTVITGSLNVKKMPGLKTDATATFSNEAVGFVASRITFRNEAGPEGEQAVAFRSIGDMAALSECSFEGYQDTLFYQSYRQFYSNCRIYGTVDFIFGRGDCVIQDSTIIVRKPMPGQPNTITADGRLLSTPGSNGLVLHKCTIVPDESLLPVRLQVQTFFGRPWSANALTVVMQCTLGDFIRPEGWKIWEGPTGGDNHKTCEVYTFRNDGPGANTQGWSSIILRYKDIRSPAEVAKYTVSQFLKGRDWLPQTGIPFRLGLYQL